MKQLRMVVILLGLMIFAAPQLGLAEEAGNEQLENKTLKVGEIQVTASGEEESVVVTPSAITINIEEYDTPGMPQNVVDILKDQAIIDFRGRSDLSPDYDTIQMRGFDANHYVTAVDGLNIQTAGGIGSTQVDYGTLPLGMIESIEIMPGPHSALYSGKSEGGVINLKTKTPKRYTDLKPDFRVSTGYRSYNTQNHSINADGGAGSFVYGFGFQNYHTDGYLRHNETDIDNYSLRLGYILPNDAYLSLNMTYTDRDKERVATNDPSLDDYSSRFPETPDATYQEWKDNRWDEEAESYRLNYMQPTSVGLWTLGAYYSRRDRDYSYLKYIDSSDESKGLYRYHSESERSETGCRIQDEIKFSENHITTVGFDMTLGYNGPFDYTYYGYKTSGTPRRKKFDVKGGYLEHKWSITPRLTVTPGLRYENVKTWHNNYSFTKNTYYVESIHKKFLDREFNQLVPKSFLTYELDNISDVLRDTSLSLGVSKIWNATSFCNGCARTSGAYVDPEHGIAYDLILSRRLWGDINLKVDYSYYKIKDYVVWVYSKHRNSTKYAEYFNYLPAGASGQGGSCQYNLDEMTLQGVEISFDGHLLDNLSFYLNYAYLEMEDKEGVPWGKEAADERAKHRINAGLRYKVLDNTLLMLDYKFQDKQIARDSEEVEEDVWVVYTVPISSYHLFDFAVEQKFFKKIGFLEDMSLKVYVNNLFDEEYENTSGYPMTDRTYGAALRFSF